MAFGVDDIVGAGLQIINKLIPDPQAKLAAQQKWLEMEHDERLKTFNARAEIVKAEAASQSWLAASWRPVTMLTFVGLIVARWFGWAAPELSPDEYLKLWDIVELGLGGYVIGRTAEKIVPAVAGSLKRT